MKLARIFTFAIGLLTLAALSGALYATSAPTAAVARCTNTC